VNDNDSQMQSPDIEQRLTEAGIAPTPQRRVIAQAILDHESHPDAETIYHLARQIDPHLGIATVYRTLKLFAERGLVDRHDFGDGRTRYEVSPDIHHDHLICVRCGSVVEFSNSSIESLQEQVADGHGFQLLDHRLELYGVCAQCHGTPPKIITRAAAQAPATAVRTAARNLSQLLPGESGKVIRVGAGGKLGQRLLSMGLVVGETVRVEQVAPFGDPIGIRVKNYCLALRRQEAEAIVLEVGAEASEAAGA
jgi:Fur family ferric uptake transcriptional regulator